MIWCLQLTLKKGDKITVTQIEDGGWWEGTLNGKTGWFPSNYVKESKGILYFYKFLNGNSLYQFGQYD